MELQLLALLNSYRRLNNDRARIVSSGGCILTEFPPITNDDVVLQPRIDCNLQTSIVHRVSVHGWIKPSDRCKVTIYYAAIYTLLKAFAIVLVIDLTIHLTVNLEVDSKSLQNVATSLQLPHNSHSNPLKRRNTTQYTYQPNTSGSSPAK